MSWRENEIIAFVRMLVLFAMLCLFCVSAKGIVVVDSIAKGPLPGASIFNNLGNFVGVSGANGRLPNLTMSDFPITIRYIGFYEKTVDKASDTIFMVEDVMELPELVVETKSHNVLHMLAYVREYSTLSTYTDTIFLFREKMVDYMLPADKKVKINSWETPRVLTSKSYYHFRDNNGLDSVSGQCRQHFSWSDWIGVAPEFNLPPALRNVSHGTDTIKGKYSPTEIWSVTEDKISVSIDVLASQSGWEWVPYHSSFFRDNIDFDRFNIIYNYNNVGDTLLSPADIKHYSFNIESNGRGSGVFLFNRKDEPFFVTTYAETFFIDKEYITVKEAKKWQNLKQENRDLMIYEPDFVPELLPQVQLLVDRVNSLDNESIRSSLAPDMKLKGRRVDRVSVGQRIAKRIKGIFGIDQVVGKHKREKRWKEFREERKMRNKGKS